jgi:pimeloyl-ACP methyl ester carboxylesterase
MDEIKPDGASGSPMNAGPGDDDGASLPQLDGVTHRFVDLPGLRMHVAEVGEGPPLLMLHGFPQHWWAWRKMLPALAGHYRVICPDLRGAGWTDAPREGYERDQLVADVVALLDALQLDQVNLVGYDWGGHIGFRLCLSHSERIERFICIATPHPYPEFHARVLLSMWRLWPMFAIAMPALGPWLLRSGRQRLPRWLMTSDTDDPSVWSAEDIDVFAARLRNPARARAGSAVYRNFILKEAKRGAAGEYRETRLRTPTLSLYGTVLYGSDDPSREHPEILGGYENHADDFTLEHIPGSGYYIAEEQPDAAVASVRRFLTSPRS